MGAAEEVQLVPITPENIPCMKVSLTSSFKVQWLPEVTNRKLRALLNTVKERLYASHSLVVTKHPGGELVELDDV